ncbi:DegT/DnrJ/EryC1/StrS family aminotransferase [Neobacillus sp. MM2021_6]|uniref:DegT/DnrJ/EryC1/StrS family aminotransferase n=1 Tax=Bacillaceae TaxID=186817 RepID=UPI00140D2388|nr:MULTISPECIES: DegT/DnrJ/EryC1/StrS family aminotransferase [Bacillaceae]MBO0961866.1 DegT/DnrJ/EryC1/StrS family aminotransferase [Neobacillus sp. MM2021_6]NHC18967.1 DegT/DnrJ/EryC1/StrS family aminotransferase [Bacillus sp. MM2020_4]
MINLVDLRRQFQSVKDEVLQAMTEVIDSGQYVLGPKVKELEAKIAQRLGVTEAIAVANGTDALVLTLESYGIGPGDEVITTPFTFFASAEAISQVGAVPVFADVDPVTYNIDPFEIEKKITKATKAIIPVHLFGQPADMDEINEIAKKRGLFVIEDACQAFGATYKNQAIGSLGDAACFSFFPTKNLGTMGDGGIITTSDAELAGKIRKLRTHGSTKKYYHDRIGYNSRLDEIHAAILLVNLTKIDEWNQKRRELAERYQQYLGSVPHVKLPLESDNRSHIYHLFCIESDRREELMQEFLNARIQTGVYYPLCLHLQEVYLKLDYKKGDFPIAESLSEKLFAIPMHPFLSKDEQNQIIAILQQNGGN